MDTDGAWVRAGCLPALGLADLPADAPPGGVRVTDQVRAGRWWGPQHYWYAGRFTLAGLSAPTIRPGTATVDYRETVHSLYSWQGRPATSTISRTREAQLDRLHVDGSVDDDGWVVPPQVWLAPDGVPR